MNVPFLDLTRQYKTISKRVDAAIQDVVTSQQFVLGPTVLKFEEKLAKYCGTKFAVGCSSGTDALLMSLLAAGIGKGDEVITTPFTFFSTAEVIIRVGAKPIFVDIDEKTFNIDVSQIEQVISSKTRAIIPVHIFGQCVNMTEVLSIAKSHRLIVIEDAAQAIGAKWNEERAGSMGDFGCFSFFPSKNLGAFGDGGAVVTNSEKSYRDLLMIRQHGLNPEIRYDHVILGGNFRMDAIQAAVLAVKLDHIEEWNEARRSNANYYEQMLFGICETQKTLCQAHHVYNQFTIKVDKRDKVQEKLAALGVPSVVYYPFPISCRSAIPEQMRNSSLPICKKVCDQVLSLPIFPELTSAEKDLVVMSLTEAVQ